MRNQSNNPVRTTEGKIVHLHPSQRGETVKSNSSYYFGKLPFNVHGGIRFVNPSEVLYLQAQNNYTMLHFLDGSSFLVSKVLKQVSSHFPKHFLRVHQSYFVNPMYLEFYDRKKGRIALVDGRVLPVSRSGKSLLHDAIRPL